MAPTGEPAHRTLQYRAEGDDITVREPEEVDGEEGIMEIRMPIASTGEVRNEGDEPLTRRELEGFARQINERAVGVFAGHGTDSTIAEGRYSAFGRLGEWTDGEFVARGDGGDEGVLMATARMPEPRSLPDATGSYRRGLAILKEQAERGIAQDASIGWRVDESFPGGLDLMEASFVGIGADPRTNTDDDAAEVVAREAVAAGADPADLVERVERAVRAPGEGRDLDDPEFAEGDAVEWSFQGEPVHGRVADIGAEFTVSGNTITGEEGEAVYLIHEWDEEVEAFREENVAKPESSLSESQMEMPAAADENFASMTDDDATDSDPPDGGTTDDAQDADSQDGDTDTRAPDDLTEDRLLTFTAVHFDGIDESDFAEAIDAADAEFVGSTDVEELFDLVSVVTGAEYGTVEDAMTALMDSDADADGEQEGDKPDDEEEDEDEERNLADRLDDIEDELAAVRSGEVDIDTPDSEDSDEEPEPDAEQDADDPDADRDAEGEETDDTADGPNWRA